MRPLNLLLSSIIAGAGIFLALHAACARYGGTAEREIAFALGLTGAACLATVSALRWLKAAPHIKIATYIIIVAILTCVIVGHQVGVEGILPRKNGQQSVGLWVIVANADLFGLVWASVATACRGVFVPRRVN